MEYLNLLAENKSLVDYSLFLCFLVDIDISIFWGDRERRWRLYSHKTSIENYIEGSSPRKTLPIEGVNM